MTVVIGKKYDETKARLTYLIRQDAVPVRDGRAEHHVCYFCSQPITGQMKIVTEKEKKGETTYFLDKTCYEKTQEKQDPSMN
jgi:hypothetical protein